MENRTYIVLCISEAGRPESSYRWTLDGVDIKDEHLNKIQIDAHKNLDGVLLGCNVSNNYTIVKNTPTYDTITLIVECKSEYNIKFFSRKYEKGIGAIVFFFSSDRPRVDAGNHVTVHEHGFVQLNCSSYGNPMPQPNNFKWIDNHGNEHSGQNYRMTLVNITNAGTYECAVRVNGYYGPLTGSASTKVTVLCKFISHCTV